MALFLLIARDRPDSVALRLDNRPEHLEHMKSYGRQIMLAGPYLNDAGEPIGSMILFDVAARADVEAFVAADPYSRADLFASCEIHPWRQTLPATA